MGETVRGLYAETNDFLVGYICWVLIRSGGMHVEWGAVPSLWMDTRMRGYDKARSGAGPPGDARVLCVLSATG